MTPEFEGLSLVDLIDLLEPAPEPGPISMMPQTAGWIWLGAGLFALVIWAIARRAAHRRANAYRRAALAELGAAGNDPAQIAALLRRAALAGFARDTVAPLTGADWLRFLDQTYGGNGFRTGPGRILGEAPYRPCPPDPALAPLARDWIVRHQRPPA